MMEPRAALAVAIREANHSNIEASIREMVRGSIENENYALVESFEFKRLAKRFIMTYALGSFAWTFVIASSILLFVIVGDPLLTLSIGDIGNFISSVGTRSLGGLLAGMFIGAAVLSFPKGRAFEAKYDLDKMIRKMFDISKKRDSILRKIYQAKTPEEAEKIQDQNAVQLTKLTVRLKKTARDAIKEVNEMGDSFSKYYDISKAEAIDVLNKVADGRLSDFLSNPSESTKLVKLSQ